MVVEDNFAGQQDSLSQNLFYMHLGKDDVEYLFSSMDRAKLVSKFVDLAESMGLTHSQNFIDSVIIKVNSNFYISQNLDGGIYMVGKYTDLTYITSSTIKELLSKGYDLEFDGILILITRSNHETERKQVEFLKALGDQYPLGFSRFNSEGKS